MVDKIYSPLVGRAIESIQEFGISLFGKLYVEASAYMVLDESGAVPEIKLFDTAFPGDVLRREWPEGTRVVLYSNHPNGRINPSKDYLKNLSMVPDATLCIVCEDTCVTVL